MMATSAPPSILPLVCIAAHGADLFGDRPAICGNGGRLSFVELHERVGRVAAVLARRVRPGDRVAVRAANRCDTVITVLAIIRLGAVVVPVSHRLPAVGLARVTKAVGASVLLQDSATALEPHDTGVVAADVWPIDDIMERAGALAPQTPIAIPPERPCVAVFTSGSSGQVRAALLTFGNLCYSAIGSNRNIDVGKGDRWLLSLPLYHVAGLGIVFRCLLGGAEVVVPEEHPDLESAVREEGITHISVVPAQARRLLRSSARIGRLKAILVGGGPVSPDLLGALRAEGAHAYFSYGLTEMSSQVSTTRGDTGPQSSDDCGRVLPFRSVCVDEEGEILVRGETLFAGYLAEGPVQPQVDAGGWFRTGDAGYFDPDGRLHVIGRRDNMFVSGGENIYPEEIERALCDVGGVERAIVVDVPDAEFGARPVAFLEFSGARLDLDEIRNDLRSVLPGYKLPDAVYEIPEGVERVLSKVDRSALRELAERMRS